ncbi:MAG TPA: GerMN domain-containing protein [Acidimicrobiales bacterium]|jgi:spore germination protein GerM|nr:GerMN domain-containing protein [Acidimicrobiales bacterium]
MTRPSLAATALLAVALHGCSVPAQERARTVRDAAVPFDLLDPSAPPLVPPSTSLTSEQLALCFVREGRLVVVTQELAPPITLRDAVAALTGPPQGAGPLRTALTEPSLVSDVRLVGGIARVDLVAGVSALPTEEQLLAVAQIVCTLTGRPGVGQVSFTLDGARLPVPKGDGSLVTSPVARDDYSTLMA